MKKATIIKHLRDVIEHAEGLDFTSEAQDRGLRAALEVVQKYSETGPDTNSKTMEVLNSPMVQWDSLVSKLDSGALQAIERSADAICERAARLSAYLAERGADGLGDKGHYSGVKRQNKEASAVRKALGFNQPRNDIRF